MKEPQCLEVVYVLVVLSLGRFSVTGKYVVNLFTYLRVTPGHSSSEEGSFLLVK